MHLFMLDSVIVLITTPIRMRMIKMMFFSVFVVDDNADVDGSSQEIDSNDTLAAAENGAIKEHV